MIIKRQSLIDALKLLTPGAGDADLGGSKLVVFDKGWIRTLNEKLSVSYKLETGVDGALPIKELLKILKRMKGDDIAISDDEDQVQFRCGLSELTLLKIKEDIEGLISKLSNLGLDDAKWAPIPKTLLEGLKLSLLSAEDSSIGKLSGVLIKGSFIFSTDNYRLSKYDMREKIQSDEVIRLRTSSVKDLINISKGIAFDSVSISNGRVNLKSNDNLIISIKQVPLGDYPLNDVFAAFDQVTPDDKVYELPDNLEKFIDRAGILAGQGVGELNFDTQIILRSGDDNLIITGKNSLGELTNKIPWPGVLPLITINPATLIKVLSLTRSFRVTLNNVMVLFEIPNFKFLIMASSEQVQKADPTKDISLDDSIQKKLQALREKLGK